MVTMWRATKRKPLVFNAKGLNVFRLLCRVFYLFVALITINSSKRVVAISGSYPGSVHDKRVFDIEETIKKIPPQARHILDKGYVGVDQENPGANILIPFRKKRGQKELSDSAKQINKYLSKHRISVEHVLSKIKNFRICSYTYRGRRENFNQIFKNVVALYNFNYAAA